MAKVFFSYSHDDEQYRDQLEKHLALLKYQGLIEAWHDRRITAGSTFDEAIEQEIGGLTPLHRGPRRDAAESGCICSYRSARCVPIIDFEVLRARMLYDQKARKAGSTSVRKAIRKDDKSSRGLEFFSTAKRPAPSVEFVDEVIEYGPHIPTLVKLLEEGHFE